MMHTVSRRFVIVSILLALVAPACRSAQAPPPASASRPGAAAAERPLPDSIRWVEQSAEYVAALEQTYRLATAAVEAAARGRAAGSWAVVLDADETVLNNAKYQEERARAGLAYSTDSWNAWVKRREATPLPGAEAFLSRVRRLGGRIAIVTNRLQSECEDTKAVFDRFSLAYDAILCRPDGSPSDKNPRFVDVAEGRSPASSTPLTVVAFVGDNILDFPGKSQAIRGQGAPAFAEFGVRYFLLPNPMYGSWQ
jgi:5'-nucleotidase (lipoprotein e(P4) family)